MLHFYVNYTSEHIHVNYLTVANVFCDHETLPSSQKLSQPLILEVQVLSQMILCTFPHTFPTNYFLAAYIVEYFTDNGREKILTLLVQQAGLTYIHTGIYLGIRLHK